ncbi:MAG: beta strand repeat-containing protein, partial [Candidatus Kapaibacterium sp.]
MKKLIVFLGAIVMLACMNFKGHAQLLLSNTPRTISYQGFLLDAAKKPITGNHKISIKLYDAPVEGALMHSESFSTSPVSGVFSVLIGSNEPLESSLHFDKPYWLGVSVDDGAELVPRTAFSSVPYAIHADAAGSLAKGASGAVTTLNGKSGDISIKGGDGTIVESTGNTIIITAIPQATTGNIHTQATTVNSITGTANQILANGTSGSKQSGDVTLTLPQNINTGASPTFNNVTLSGLGVAGVVHNSAAGTLSTALETNNDIAANAAIAYSKLNLVGSISNADVAAGANIAGNKLNLTNVITSGDIVAGTIVNSDISAGAAIAGSKLNLTNSITSGDIVSGTIMNSDINAGAAIAASKLNLANAITSGDIATGTIMNSDINANAAIAGSKLNLTNDIVSTDIVAGAIVNSNINANANIAYNKLNLAGSIVDNDIAGGANIAYSKLNLGGNIVNGDIAAGANIAGSKLNLTNDIVSSDIVAGAIMNSNINAAANIAYTKLN